MCGLMPFVLDKVFIRVLGVEEKMAAKKNLNTDGLLAELEIHKTEYSALRTEILQLMESERQYLNLSLVAFGAGLGLSPIITEQKVYVVLLLLPLVFHVLLWEMLVAVRSIGRIATYFITNLIPRINELLDRLGREAGTISALGWEIQTAGYKLNIPELVSLSLSPSRLWIPILSVGGLVAAYLVIIRNAGYIPSVGELALVIANLLLLIWAAVQNIKFLRSRRSTD